MRTEDNRHIAIIAAISHRNRAMGKSNSLLWHLPRDMEHFRTLTTGHPVVMGRKTWESIPQKFRPLPDRTNVVISRDPTYLADGAHNASSLEEAIHYAQKIHDTIYIIGGAQIYTEALPLCTELYLTLVDDEPEADVFFPEYEHLFKLVEKSEKQTENDILFHFTKWLRKD